MCLYIYNRIIRLNIMPCLEMSTFLSQRTQLIKIGVTDNSRVNGRPFIPYAVFLILRNLFELFLEDRDKIFSNPENNFRVTRALERNRKTFEVKRLADKKKSKYSMLSRTHFNVSHAISIVATPVASSPVAHCLPTRSFTVA